MDNEKDFETKENMIDQPEPKDEFHVTPPGDMEYPAAEDLAAEAERKAEEAQALSEQQDEQPEAEVTPESEPLSKDMDYAANLSALTEAAEVKTDETVAEPVVATMETPQPSEPVISAPAQASISTDSTDTSYADAPSAPAADATNGNAIKPKWNWGAFVFPMWFGIAHRAYLGLLILLGMIPWIGWIFAIVWMIVFGFHGEKWALENRDNKYRDEEEFRKIMDGWNRAGLIAFIVGAVATVLLIIVMIFFFAVIISNWHPSDNNPGNFNPNFGQ